MATKPPVLRMVETMAVLQEARRDLERVAALAPQADVQAQQALQQLADLQVKGRMQERQAFGGIFAKP